MGVFTQAAMAFGLLTTSCVAIPAPQSNVIAASTASSLNTKTWNPPANLKPALDQVWKHQMSTYSPKPDPLQFKNYGYHQVIANNGSLNFCVRWDSKQTADAATRKAIEVALQKQTKQWMDVLKGFEGWPYAEVPVKVTGWAARSQSLLPGYTASEGFKFYTDKDAGGIPQCAEACGRFFNQNGQYPRCPGGKENHYDMSLWLTDGMNGGAGGDWGQRLGTQGFVSAAKTGQSSIHIFLHEMGHTFGLDDFYDYTPQGVKNFIMNAGSSQVITEFDAWMMRDWWRHLKPIILR